MLDMHESINLFQSLTQGARDAEMTRAEILRLEKQIKENGSWSWNQGEFTAQDVVDAYNMMVTDCVVANADVGFGA
jgi:hypothetical protein